MTSSSADGGSNREFSFCSSPSSMMYACSAPDATAEFLRTMNSAPLVRNFDVHDPERHSVRLIKAPELVALGALPQSPVQDNVSAGGGYLKGFFQQVLLHQREYPVVLRSREHQGYLVAGKDNSPRSAL